MQIKRGERTWSNYQEVVIQTSPRRSEVFLIDTDWRFFLIDNGGFDPAVHRSQSDQIENKRQTSTSVHTQGSVRISWPWKRWILK